MNVLHPVQTPRSSTDFAQLVHEASTEAGRLQRGAELAVAMIPGCDHAGVTVLTPTYIETVAASDDVVRRGDAWQHELSEGPGLDSVRSRMAVVSQDIKLDPRWRTWGRRAAADLGLRSTLSLPLADREGRVVSINLYADRVDAWDRRHQGLARGLADQLALAAEDARLLDDRQRALDLRSGTGLAQGIVMERFQMNADEAFDYLQRLSLGTHVRLAHLAEHIVETRDLPELPVWEPHP